MERFRLDSFDVLYAAVFWLLPLCLCLTLLRLGFGLLRLYVAHFCLSVGLLLSEPMSGSTEQGALFTLILISMGYMTYLFWNRNALYPLLTRDPRLWRRAERYEIGRNVMIAVGGEKVPGILLDCSAIGVAVTLSLEDVRKHFAEPSGQSFHVLIPEGEQNRPAFRIPVESVWIQQMKGGRAKIGCRVSDPVLAKAFLMTERVKKPSQSRLSDVGGDSSLEADIRRSALTLWLICIGLALLLPR